MKHKNVSWCDGWGCDRHPTQRRLTAVRAGGVTLLLCPACLREKLGGAAQQAAGAQGGGEG